MAVRDAIQQIVVEHRRRYGYRRVTAELCPRGMPVNHKRPPRLMREDNLQAFEPKAPVVTTQSDHDAEVYLNLARRMQPNAINQLRVADITYIRLRQEFVYLALVLNVFSRKVVGRGTGPHPHRAPSDAGPGTHHRPAPTRARPGAPLRSRRTVLLRTVHALLNLHGILPSMSRSANPYDNAFCDSFIKTLNREQIYANRYQYIDELNAQLEEFIDRYYNRLQLHSALGYETPEEFEAASTLVTLPPVPSVSFPRHGEIYRSWKSRKGRPPKANGEPVRTDSPTRRIDESPVGYSLHPSDLDLSLGTRP
jgi:transposase InsO family protein